MDVFDRILPIHETPEDKPQIDSVIERLAEMLEQYHVKYAITLATLKEQKEDPRPLRYRLSYNSDQHLELSLVVALWARVYLTADPKKVAAPTIKSLAVVFED